jgi:hypothetical protein
VSDVSENAVASIGYFHAMTWFVLIIKTNVYRHSSASMISTNRTYTGE